MAKITVEIDTETKEFKLMRDGSEISDPRGVNIGCYKYSSFSDYWASYTVKEDGLDVTYHIGFSNDHTTEAKEIVSSIDFPAQAAKAAKNAVNAMKLAAAFAGVKIDDKKTDAKPKSNEDIALDENDDIGGNTEEDEPVKPREYSLKKYDWRK